MNTSGVVMVLFGVVLVGQVLKGGALQRLGLIGCPAGSTPPPPDTGTKKPGGGLNVPVLPFPGSPTIPIPIPKIPKFF